MLPLPVRGDVWCLLMPASARGIAHSVVRQDKGKLLETLSGLQFSVVRKKHRKPLKGSLLSGNPEVVRYGKVGKRNLCLGRAGDIASPKHMRRAGHFIKTCVVHDKKTRRKVVLEGAADLLCLARAGEGGRERMVRGRTGPGGTGKGTPRAWPLQLGTRALLLPQDAPAPAQPQPTSQRLQPVMVKPLTNLHSWAPWGRWKRAGGIDLPEKK